MVSTASPGDQHDDQPVDVTLEQYRVADAEGLGDASGGVHPSGTITFKLYGPTGAVVDTETAVNGNGTYTTPTGYTLPTTGTVTGTYQWVVSYSGDANNNPA